MTRYLLIWLCLLGCLAMTGQTQARGLWLWDQTLATDPVQREIFFNFAAGKDISVVYIDSQALIRRNQPALRDFVLAAKTRGIEVDFLFGDASWALSRNHSIATDLAEAAAAYSRAYPAARPRGLHYDVEPYLLPQWKTSKNAVAKQYLDLIEKLNAITAPASLQLTVDIPFWFDGERIAWGGKKKRPLNEWVQDLSDRAVLMDYRDTADLIINFAANEIAYGNKTGKKVGIGVETQCGQDPAYVSFCDKGNAAMEAALATVESHYASNKSYDGISIHHYGSYITLRF
jgi:hypothetical protein